MSLFLIKYLDNLFDKAKIATIGGAPGASGITLASETKRPLYFVSRFVSTISPMAAVPPG